jgi:hypothetical protein
MLVTHLLLAGAAAALAVACWHRHKVEGLRQQYLARHGMIEVPEALYFDGMAFEVILPALLLWFGFQVGSAAVFCSNYREVGYLGGLIFWTLWVLTWGLCLL